MIWRMMTRALPLTKRSQSGTSALERAWMRTLRAYRFTPGSERCMDSFSAFRVGRYSRVRKWIGACTATHPRDALKGRETVNGAHDVGRALSLHR